LIRALEIYQKALEVSKQERQRECLEPHRKDGELSFPVESNPSNGSFGISIAIPLARRNYKCSGEGVTLANIGFVYTNMGQYSKAIESYQQALKVFRELGDHAKESNVLNGIAVLYANLAQYAKALESCDQSIEVAHSDKDPLAANLATISAFNTKASIYNHLGNYSKALEIFQIALPVTQALESLQQALSNDLAVIKPPESLQSGSDDQIEIIKTRKPNRIEEGRVLGNISLMYTKLGDYSKALESYQKALTILQEMGDRAGEGTLLNNAGLMYEKLGQYPKALEFYRQASVLLREVGDRVGEVTASNNLGLIYSNLGQYSKALDVYQQALIIGREIGDRSGEGTTLNNIGDLLEAQKQPALAIVFLKQSVSTYEHIRGELKALSLDQQKSYTATVADTYRHLADLLLQQDRVLEAQQILDLLKVQELDDYLRDLRGTAQTIEFLQPEREILQRYHELQKTAIEIGSELADLRKLDSKNALDPTQKQRFAHLAKLEIDINTQFNAFIDSDPIQKLTAELIHVTRNQNLNLEDLAGLQTDLRQLNAALLYPLILEDRLELIITTPNSRPLRRVVKVKREELNRKIQEFRSALGNRQDNAQALAQELYT